MENRLRHVKAGWWCLVPPSVAPFLLILLALGVIFSSRLIRL
ncbi:MAG: hypothetical protein Q8R91_06320 [Candidatus Omnitrophota bacterium]|nr:hypothetical protein [Candidatus Omnitrophota bacterium]